MDFSQEGYDDNDWDCFAEVTTRLAMCAPDSLVSEYLSVDLSWSTYAPYHLRFLIFTQEQKLRATGTLRRVSRSELPSLSDEQQQEQVRSRLIAVYSFAERAIAGFHIPEHRSYTVLAALMSIDSSAYSLSSYARQSDNTEDERVEIQATSAEIRLRAEGKARQVKMEEWSELSPGVRVELLAQRLEAMGHSYPVAMELAKSAL